MEGYGWPAVSECWQRKVIRVKHFDVEKTFRMLFLREKLALLSMVHGGVRK